MSTLLLDVNALTFLEYVSFVIETVVRWILEMSIQCQYFGVTCIDCL